MGTGAQSAGSFGSQVWAVADVCFTFAEPDFHGTLRSVDEVHAVALINLHGEYTVVLRTAELLQHLPA